MGFIDNDIIDYSKSNSSKPDEILENLERESHLTTVNGAMVSGSYQGRVLSIISKLISPKAILEIGTFTGYSALCLADGLIDDGVLHTIEIEEENETLIRKYLEIHPLGSKIHLHIGDAFEIIPKLKLTWDLIFIDANKMRNLDFYNLVLPKLRLGGVIIIDNVLWYGKVLNSDMDKETKAIHELNQYINNDSRVENLILPIRDGISIIRKI